MMDKTALSLERKPSSVLIPELLSFLYRPRT